MEWKHLQEEQEVLLALVIIITEAVQAKREKRIEIITIIIGIDLVIVREIEIGIEIMTDWQRSLNSREK